MQAAIGYSKNHDLCIRVMLISRESILRLGLATAIRSFPQMELVGTADNMGSAMELLGPVAPSIFVWVNEQDEAPPDWARNLPIVQIGKAVGALSVFLNAAELESAITALFAAGNRRPIPLDRIAASVARQKNALAIAPPAKSPFRGNQLRVLALMTKGLTNFEIAKLTGLTVPTISYHASSIFKKLGVANRTEAVVIATQRGLVSDKDI